MDFNFDYTSYQERLHKGTDTEVWTDLQVIRAALGIDDYSECLFLDILMKLKGIITAEIIRRYEAYDNERYGTE